MSTSPNAETDIETENRILKEKLRIAEQALGLILDERYYWGDIYARRALERMREVT